jgi:mRNA interferase MazF
MAMYRFGDIVLVNFPFADRPAEKRRPGIVLAHDPHGDLLLARVTTKQPQLLTDIILKDWHSEGLNRPSTVRLLKLATMNEQNVLRTVGGLSTADMNSIAAAFMEFAQSLRS